MHIPLLYIPSFYGDIRLESSDVKQTRIIAERTSPQEKDALLKLAEYASKRNWIEHTLDMKNEGETLVNAPLLKVQKELVAFLKPGRTMVTAVKFTNGAVEEVHATSETWLPSTSVAVPEEKKPEVAASVAKPTQGCPAPAFKQAEIKARRVLEAFLDEQQREDFRRHNRFISVGSFTGHRYMITSRFETRSLAEYGRTLFDLDEGRALCVHDWVVPAAEEMLALHLMLQLPQHEPYLRHLEN